MITYCQGKKKEKKEISEISIFEIEDILLNVSKPYHFSFILLKLNVNKILKIERKSRRSNTK